MENVANLLKHIRINDYTIKNKKGKQSAFGAIYNLGPIELKILKTYIKINLANNFIYLFKFLARALILFDKKPDRNFCFYVDYQALNNIIIKN